MQKTWLLPEFDSPHAHRSVAAASKGSARVLKNYLPGFSMIRRTMVRLTSNRERSSRRSDRILQANACKAIRRCGTDRGLWAPHSAQRGVPRLAHCRWSLWANDLRSPSCGADYRETARKGPAGDGTPSRDICSGKFPAGVFAGSLMFSCEMPCLGPTPT